MCVMGSWCSQSHLHAMGWMKFHFDLKAVLAHNYSSHESQVRRKNNWTHEEEVFIRRGCDQTDNAAVETRQRGSGIVQHPSLHQRRNGNA